MQVVLISTYELGRQPFGLASAAAWLRAAGHSVVCVDLSVSQMPQETLRNAHLVALHLPMHTATRLALPVIANVQRVNPEAHLGCFGLYASLNAGLLRSLGVGSICGGEFEAELVRWADALRAGPAPVALNGFVSLERLKFRVPDRSGLPGPEEYAPLRMGGETRLAGYTEASRGCKHLCRHCPIVPVYRGVFRIVQAEVVLEDIRQQVAQGVRHITFGDPDFFNGPSHATRIVEQLHRELPEVTYDATIKIEHLRRHSDYLTLLKDTGCLFVTSAVESVDDRVLAKLEKGHTRADFCAVLADFRRVGLALSPTFIPFTPWTTVASYGELLRTLRDLDLVDAVSPVQLALRLLIPTGSRLLELEDVCDVVTGFDPPALLYRWQHADPRVDALAAKAIEIAGKKQNRRVAFEEFWALVHGTPPVENWDLLPRAAIPYLDEPWYC